MPRKRLTLDIKKILRTIKKIRKYVTGDEMMPFEPTSERDFTNIVYLFLKLKLPRGYDVDIYPEPVYVKGKKHTPDLAINEQVAIEIKIAKTSTSAHRAITQAERYREGGYPASIALIYSYTDFSLQDRELKSLEKRRIYPIIIPAYEEV